MTQREPVPLADRVRSHRERLRAPGLRPVQVWLAVVGLALLPLAGRARAVTGDEQAADPPVSSTDDACSSTVGWSTSVDGDHPGHESPEAALAAWLGSPPAGAAPPADEWESGERSDGLATSTSGGNRATADLLPDGWAVLGSTVCQERGGSAASASP